MKSHRCPRARGGDNRAFGLAGRAAVMHGRTWEATYVAAFQPTFGPSRVPYSGTMNLKFNQGIVSGTYVADSVRPDPLYGRTVAVSGKVSEGRITLIFQSPGNLPCAARSRATARSPATASIRGTIYSLLAKVKSSP